VNDEFDHFQNSVPQLRFRYRGGTVPTYKAYFPVLAAKANSWNFHKKLLLLFSFSEDRIPFSFIQLSSL
jgi:hypothetical protein